MARKTASKSSIWAADADIGVEKTSQVTVSEHGGVVNDP